VSSFYSICRLFVLSFCPSVDRGVVVLMGGCGCAPQRYLPTRPHLWNIFFC